MNEHAFDVAIENKLLINFVKTIEVNWDSGIYCGTNCFTGTISVTSVIRKDTCRLWYL